MANRPARGGGAKRPEARRPPLHTGKWWNQQRLRDGGPDLAAPLERRQIDKPCAIGVGGFQRAGELYCQPRLADSAGTDEGQQPRLVGDLSKVVHFPLAAEERTEICRQITAG